MIKHRQFVGLNDGDIAKVQRSRDRAAKRAAFWKGFAVRHPKALLSCNRSHKIWSAKHLRASARPNP